MENLIHSSPDALWMDGFDPACLLAAETAFTQDNGWMRVRGYPDESTHAPSVPFAAFAGVTDEEGRAVCAADWLFVRLSVNGQHVLTQEKTPDYHCRLDLRTGLLNRRYTLTLQDDLRLTVQLERALGWQHMHCAAQRLTLVSSRDALLSMNLGVDGNLPDPVTGACPWRQTGCKTAENRAGLSLRHPNGAEIACLFEVTAPFPLMALDIDRRVVFGLSGLLRAGQSCVVERKIVNAVNPGAWSLQSLDGAPSLDQLTAENAAWYDSHWLPASRKEQSGVFGRL